MFIYKLPDGSAQYVMLDEVPEFERALLAVWLKGVEIIPVPGLEWAVWLKDFLQFKAELRAKRKAHP